MAVQPTSGVLSLRSLQLIIHTCLASFLLAASFVAALMCERGAHVALDAWRGRCHSSCLDQCFISLAVESRIIFHAIPTALAIRAQEARAIVVASCHQTEMILKFSYKEKQGLQHDVILSHGVLLKSLWTAWPSGCYRKTTVEAALHWTAMKQ
eukprot:2617970-Amphidinium_carterae.1